MDLPSVIARAPRTLPAGHASTGATYRLADDLVAIHGSPAGEATVASLEGGKIAVEPVAAARDETSGGQSVGPVYRLLPGGAVAVPTGRALVRFAEGDSAADRREQLAESGYELEQVLPYAPHAAWVRAASGGIAESLRDLHRLEGLPGVESIEPQMISEAARRS